MAVDSRYIIVSLIIIGIVLCILFTWSHIKGAPWLPTRMKKVGAMLSLAKLQPNDILYDLGCGDGRVLIMAARRFDATAVGIEINLLFYLWCQLLIAILGLRKKIKVVYGNFFKYNLKDADVVICYLLQETNDKLEEKLVQELKPNSRVISNSFTFHKLKVVMEDPDKGIYLYKR
ncbi:MAG: class I SAM-dependent methyltransferase [Candidatus Thorarchaeota archaeon]